MQFFKEENELFENLNFLSLLGKGSYGSVYKVYDKINKEYFALKEIKINLNHIGVSNEILPYRIEHENILYYSAVLISRRPSKLNYLSCNGAQNGYMKSPGPDSTYFLKDNRSINYFDIAAAKDVLFEAQSKIKAFIEKHEIPSTFYTAKYLKSDASGTSDIKDLVTSLVLKFTEEIIFLSNIRKFMSVQKILYNQVSSYGNLVDRLGSLSFRWAEDGSYGSLENWESEIRDVLNSLCPKVSNRSVDNSLGRAMVVQKKNPLVRCKNWRLNERERNQSISRSKIYKNKNYYLYLKTKYCDFSLRDYIDFRNHYMFRQSKIEDEANKTSDNKIYFQGSLNSNVYIPIDIYKKGVRNGTNVNKVWSLKIFKYILFGLLHLHSLGIAHNDLKCSNIMLDSESFYKPKIADFGLKSECKRHKGIIFGQNECLKLPLENKIGIECTHQNKDKIKDCKALMFILYELLYPCKTQSEMHFLLKNLKKTNRVSDEFRGMYYEESVFIEEVLSDSNITAKKILTLISRIPDA